MKIETGLDYTMSGYFGNRSSVSINAHDIRLQTKKKQQTNALTQNIKMQFI